MKRKSPPIGLAGQGLAAQGLAGQGLAAQGLGAKGWSTTWSGRVVSKCAGSASSRAGSW